MTDVMTKLKEIVERGYDNEDIQRGIVAAGKHQVDEAEVAEEEAVELDAVEEVHEDDIQEAYINTSKDAIDVLGALRAKGKAIERGQDNDQGNLANAYANDVWDVYSFIEARTSSLLTLDPKVKAAIDAMMALRKVAKGKEREPGSGKDAQFGNQIVNTLYPVMQWLETTDFDRNRNEDTSLADMLKLAGRSGVMGLSQNNLIAESLELDEEDDLEDADNKLDREIAGQDEAEVEETVEVPVAALEELMRLAGYEDYEAKIDEYENDPEEEYMDAEDQLVGLSGGLNGPKGMYPTAAGGDNAMSVKPLKVDEENFLSFESFYKKYQEFVTEEK